MWNGSISFGLVTIPVALYPATSRDELTFRLLRKSDQSPVNYKRVAEADGKLVPWMYFQKPYYLEPQKGGDKPYALLRDALRESGKMGIAKVVIRTREHLAGVKAQGAALILEIMHFGNELIDADSLKFPKGTQAKPREIGMAKKLIDGMTTKWNPDKYEDEYKTQLMAMIAEKVKHPEKKHSPTKAPRKPSNIIDLMSVLEESLSHTKAGKSKTSKSKAKAKASKASHRKAA
jgi:DNA end-binding protein Ku